MELQEAFNIVYKGLAAQNWAKSETKHEILNGKFHTICAYRGDNGCKCAAGHLIPDSVYHPKMEGTSIASVVIVEPKLKSLAGVIILDAIGFMQGMHDTSVDAADMKERFERYAQDRGLAIPA